MFSGRTLAGERDDRGRRQRVGKSRGGPRTQTKPGFWYAIGAYAWGHPTGSKGIKTSGANIRRSRRPWVGPDWMPDAPIPAPAHAVTVASGQDWCEGPYQIGKGWSYMTPCRDGMHAVSYRLPSFALVNDYRVLAASLGGSLEDLEACSRCGCWKLK